MATNGVLRSSWCILGVNLSALLLNLAKCLFFFSALPKRGVPEAGYLRFEGEDQLIYNDTDR